MKPWIKTTFVTALAASTLVAGAALACPGEFGWGGRAWSDAKPGQIKERLGKRVDVKLARLELALALTPEQKPAWDDFKKAAAARLDDMAKGIEDRREAGHPRTALERLDRAEEANKQRARLLADTRKAVEAFYGKLGSAQKTVFDAEFDKFLFHHRHDGRGHDRHSGNGEQHGKGKKHRK